jgi:hypothetical protein
MFVTIDPYYNVQFYNECKEALNNNGVSYKEYISTKAPFYFYFEVNSSPAFINYDQAPDAYSKWLVTLTKGLTPNAKNLLLRRDSFSELKGINQYAINDALLSGAKSSEGIFFTSTRDEILRISKKYPRKIFYMGKYFDKKYRIFFTDNLIIMNFLKAEQILVKSKTFKNITELEVELNFNIFHEKDRLMKLSETPYILNGSFYQISTITQDVIDRFVLN